MTALEKKLCALADANFKRDPASRLKKFLEEVSELAEAVVNDDATAISEEAADCSFVLIDIVHLVGSDSLSAAQARKWKVIMHRKRNGILHKADRIARRAA